MTQILKKSIITTTYAIFVASCSSEHPNWMDDETGTSGIILSEDSDITSLEESSETTIKYDIFIDPDVGNCADVSVTVDQIIPTIIILIDRSGSMQEDFSGQTRWQALYNSLMNQNDGVIHLLENEIRFGIALYDGTPESCPEIIYVSPALMNYQNIDGTYSIYAPNQETPTGEALDEIQNLLSDIISNEPKAIVLATDGEPDLCSDPDGDGKELVVQSTESAYSNDIKTYVISVGLDTSSDHLQEVANVGIGKPRDEMISPAPFYETTNQMELLQAFNNIVGDFVSCQYEINGQIKPEDICSGEVLIDGEKIDCGSDWNVDGNILEIFGQSCDILKDGQSHSIEAKFPCDVVYIP